MGQTHQPHLQIVNNDNRLASLFQSLDELHTAASDGQLHRVTPLTNTELVGWLQEMIFTAQETIEEIDHQTTTISAPHLRIVK